MNDARVLLDTLRFQAAPDAAGLADGWALADVPSIVRLAGIEGASIWLNRRLRSLGVQLPAQSAERLAAAARQATARNLRVDEETFTTFSILDEAGITAVPLKAAVFRRLTDRVPYADARPTSDVDLLVQAEAAEDAWRLLVGRGYSAPRSAEKGGHHLAGLFGPLGVAVELHTSTTTTVPPAEAWRRATCDGAMAEFGGISRTVPGDTELVWHCVAHAVGRRDETRKATRLRGWLDVAALLAAGGAIDWGRIRSRIDSRECPAPAFARAWLHAAARLSGLALPPSALGSQSFHEIDLERLIAWRLHVVSRHPDGGRWADKLAEEGARGESRMPPEPAYRSANAAGRARHWMASRAARAVWLLRR